MSLIKKLHCVSKGTLCITFYLKVHPYDFEKNNTCTQNLFFYYHKNSALSNFPTKQQKELIFNFQLKHTYLLVQPSRTRFDT